MSGEVNYLPLSLFSQNPLLLTLSFLFFQCFHSSVRICFAKSHLYPFKVNAVSTIEVDC